MDDRPLFGEGSKASKHTRNRTAFLRPAATTDGRLNTNNITKHAVPSPAATVGTKAMRQNHSSNTVTAPVAVSQQPAVTITTDASAEQTNSPEHVQPCPEQSEALQLADQVQPAQAQPAQAQPTQAQPDQVQPAQAQQAQSLQIPIEQTPTPDEPPQQVAAVVNPIKPQTGSEEDRAETRQRALKGGLIVLPGRMMSSYACKIRNESSGGVMLALGEALMVPAEFYLIRDSDPGHKIACRVAWREHDRLGAEFVAALSTP